MISIVIVNYNTFELTCACIDSILRYTTGTGYEIIVVDNASPADDPDLFLQRFPGIVLVKSETNGGFAKGNNLGISLASGDVILLLNSDTLLTEDSISLCARQLAGMPQVFALSPRLVYENGKYQRNARRFRSIGRELLDLFRPALQLLPYKKRARLMLNQYFRGDFNTECDWISGAFFMFRKELLDLLPDGKLDERYFMYGEDALWCYQLGRLGYCCYFLADTQVIHIENASTPPDKQLKIEKRNLQRELDLMALIHGKGLYYFIFRLIFIPKIMMRYRIRTLLYHLLGRHVK